MASPQLSLILLAHCDSPNLRMALDYQQRQTVSAQMELILVTSSKSDLKTATEGLQGFSKCRVIELEDMEDEGAAKAAGVAAAKAPLVGFIEDHSFPAPTCSEALINAHRKGDFAAVGPVMHNANPSSSVSWGCFLAFYSPWMTAHSRSEHLPANHSCYKRDILLEYGDQLAEMLQAESILHWDLIARGYKLYQEPAANVYHLNFSRLCPLMIEHFLASRVFAGGRAKGWGASRKALYVIGSPLLPLVRLKRILVDAKRSRLHLGILTHALLPLLLNLFAGSAGEMLGYIFGDKTIRKRLFAFEQNRHLEITVEDLKAVLCLPF